MTLPVSRRRRLWLALGLCVLLFSGPLLALALGKASLGMDWRTASQASAGLAPDPAATAEPVVEVYAARTAGWRGAFAVHTWLVAKPQDGDHYTRYEVIGWRQMRGQPAIVVSDHRAPDGAWFGAAPTRLVSLRGAPAAAVIARLPAAVASYPYPEEYRAWPGPNSNTFIAWLGRELPELELAMPSNAIGKDYVGWSGIVGTTPSHTGVQLSLFGLAGVAVGLDEGLEINVLGLVTGVDVRHPGLKLPGLGRVPS